MSVREDGLLEHLPLKTPKLYHQGLQRILSAPFPVAWIGSPERLRQIVDGLEALYETNDGESLGELSRAAIEEATPEDAG